MLETTARKDDYVSLISYVQRMEDARRAKQTLHWISDKKTVVDHALPGKIQSGETLNR